MKREDRIHADDVDRFWDAIAVGASPPETSRLDGETAAMIEWLWAQSAPVRPAVARDRVWRSLQQEWERRSGGEADSDDVPDGVRPASQPRIIGHLNGRTAFPLRADQDDRRWRSMAGHLATAALLVLVLVAGLFAAGPLRPRSDSPRPSDDPASINAPDAQNPDLRTGAALLEFIVPAELLPQGDRIVAEIDMATSPPGSTGVWSAAKGAGREGLRVHYLVTGNLIMRAEGPAQVVRAGLGAAPEDVPAGTEVELGPGDTWIIRNEIPWEAVNPATTPAEILLWAFVNLDDPNDGHIYPPPSNWTVNNFFNLPPGVVVPAAPATLRIRNVELPVKGSIEPPPGGLQFALAPLRNAEGRPIVGPSIGNRPSGKVTNIGRKPATAYVLTLEPSPAANVSSATADASP